MDKPSFVYTTIRTTPERLWQALTDPDFTQRYWWSATFDTDWETGSTMTWHMFCEDRRSPAGRARVPSPPAARLYVALCSRTSSPTGWG